MRPPVCTLEKYDDAKCAGCGDETVPRPYYGFANSHTYKGKTKISVWACCEACYQNEQAIEDADRQGLRYTEIIASTNENAWNGKRCLCGAVRLVRLGFCVQCSRAHRMLDKAAAEARLVGKLLKELRAEVKTQQKAEVNQLTTMES